MAALFQDFNEAQEWRKNIANQIQAANPNWANMSREQRHEAANSWLTRLPAVQRAVVDANFQAYKQMRAAQTPQQGAPAPTQGQPPPTQQPPRQPPAPAAQQPQAGIRPGIRGMPWTEEGAKAQYGGRGYTGAYAQNKLGQWGPADPEWRHAHNPDGTRRPGIRPGVYGSSPAQIREAGIARHEAQANAAQATEDRWQAAENAAAARQRTPGQPYVAGGSFSADGRTNGEVYDQWRKRGSVSGIRRTL